LLLFNKNKYISTQAKKLIHLQVVLVLPLVSHFEYMPKGTNRQMNIMPMLLHLPLNKARIKSLFGFLFVYPLAVTSMMMSLSHAANY